MPDDNDKNGKKRHENGEENDDFLWETITQEVRPLKDALYQDLPDPVSLPAGQAKIIEKKPVDIPFSRDARRFEGFTGLDRQTDRKLKQGKFLIEARLDLHGFSAVQARQALSSFICKSYDQGYRCVLVITGKGKTEDGSGILKKNFPLWIREEGIGNYVLQYYPALPKDGGGGAFYVLLKRDRRRA